MAVVSPIPAAGRKVSKRKINGNKTTEEPRVSAIIPNEPRWLSCISIFIIVVLENLGITPAWFRKELYSQGGPTNEQIK